MLIQKDKSVQTLLIQTDKSVQTLLIQTDKSVHTLLIQTDKSVQTLLMQTDKRRTDLRSVKFQSWNCVLVLQDHPIRTLDILYTLFQLAVLLSASKDFGRLFCLGLLVLLLLSTLKGFSFSIFLFLSVPDNGYSRIFYIYVFNMSDV